MYKSTDNISRSENSDFTGYVNKDDIFNSELLYRVNEINQFTYYQITRFSGRVDLISQEIYNSTNYVWLLLLINRMTSEEFVEGKKIKFIPRRIIDSITNNL